MPANFKLRIARTVLNSVLNQLDRQLITVRSQALNPLHTVIQQQIGSIWRGQGAEEFAEELNSLVIPYVGRVADEIAQLGTELRTARKVIEQVDVNLSRQVQSDLADSFDL